LFESAQDGILILDARTGKITDVNPFLVNLLDYKHEEFVGKELWEIGLFRDVAASKAAFQELLSKKFVRYEDLPLKTKGGLSISVEFVSNVYRVNRKLVVQCNVRDITARKRADRSEQLLRQSQRMETAGQLTAGIAHDFNNFLGVILGYCEVLEASSGLTAPARRMIEEIHGAGSSARDLARDLLAFSRRKVLQPVILDLNANVRRLQTLLKRVVGDEVELVAKLGSDLGSIKVDGIQLEQVLLNLAVNSRDAMPHGGRITIETANVALDEALDGTQDETTAATEGCLDSAGHRAGRVMLAVSDTGVGMDKATQARIFEPFFSTKEIGRGTGLGLSTVLGIVQQSGSTISVQSEPEHGTKFQIFFPRCEAVAVSAEQAKKDPPRGGLETILLVDDNDGLRGLTRQLLEGCGYTVLDSAQPEEALRMAAKHKGALPLLITDVMMPVLCGPALAKRLTAASPDTRVLYTSGYVEDALMKGAMLGADYQFLEKPYTRDALVRKVREVLDEAMQPAA